MSRTVLVVAQATHTRLSIVDGLRGHAEVLSSGDDPLRDLRSNRVDVVLVALRRRDRRRTLALARQIKTDGRQPPLLGLVDPNGLLSDPVQVCRDTAADGCLQGTVDGPSLQALLQDLASPSPTVIGDSPGGWGLFRR